MRIIRKKLSLSEYFYQMISYFNNLIEKENDINDFIKQELLDVSYVLTTLYAIQSIIDISSKFKGQDSKLKELLTNIGDTFAYALLDYTNNKGIKKPEVATDAILENIMQYLDKAYSINYKQNVDELLASFAAILVKRAKNKNYNQDIIYSLRSRINKQYEHLQRLTRVTATQFTFKKDELVILMLIG